MLSPQLMLLATRLLRVMLPQVEKESAEWGLQGKSGAFMKVYLIIVYVFLGIKVLLCVAGLLMKR